MQSAGDDSFSLTLAPLVKTIKQRFTLPLHVIIIIIITAITIEYMYIL